MHICQGCSAQWEQWNGQCPQCGSTMGLVVDAAVDRLIGTVVKGRYQVLRALAQGGMGAVYLAEQVGIGQKVVLKFLKSEFSSDPDLVRRFLNEAKSYAKVVHPHAVILHDFGQDEENNLFIAMEYCEGVDLKQYLAERGRLSLSEAADVAVQLADVLGYAHTQGVIHRDLKPENIMVRAGMRGLHAKVLDFGIARLVGDSTRVTMAGMIAGTPRYMSPEQAEGKDIDHRSDIYSLGLVLFELLTGVQPFDAPTLNEILRRQTQLPMPHLHDVDPPIVSPTLDGAIQKACAKSRDERYIDMASFAADVARTLPPTPTLTPPQQPQLPQHLMNTEPMGQTYVRPSSPQFVPPNQNGPPDVSAVVYLPKSRAPYVGLVVLLLAIVAAVGWYVVRARLPGNVVVANAVAPVLLVEDAGVAVATVVVVTEVKNGVADASIPSAATVSSAESDRARDLLARATTEFEVGNLEEAGIRLRNFPAGTPFQEGATELSEKISSTQKNLTQALKYAADGNCTQAVPLFKKVVKANSHIPSARKGLEECKQSELPDSMDP